MRCVRCGAVHTKYESSERRGKHSPMIVALVPELPIALPSVPAVLHLSVVQDWQARSANPPGSFSRLSSQDSNAQSPLVIIVPSSFVYDRDLQISVVHSINLGHMQLIGLGL